MRTRTFAIEGEQLTFAQIRQRVPAIVKDETLRARLRWYQRRTWATLSEPPSYKPRPEQRHRSQFDTAVFRRFDDLGI